MAIGTAPTSVDLASTPPKRLHRVRFALPFVVAVAALWTLIDPGIEETVGPLVVILGNASAGILFIRGRRALPRAEGRAFFPIGLAFLLASAGILVVGIVNEITGTAAAFGPTDLFFVGTYTAMVAGLASLPHTQGSPTDVCACGSMASSELSRWERCSGSCFLPSRWRRSAMPRCGSDSPDPRTRSSTSYRSSSS